MRTYSKTYFFVQKHSLQDLPSPFFPDLHWPHCEVRCGRRRRAPALRRRADLRGRNGGGGQIPSAGGTAHATGSQAGPRQPDCQTQDRIWR